MHLMCGFYISVKSKKSEDICSENFCGFFKCEVLLIVLDKKMAFLFQSLSYELKSLL